MIQCLIEALATSLNLLSAGEGYYRSMLMVFGIYSA